jgi:histidinol-phosphate aminotransferase
MQREFAAMNLEFVPSHANFVLVRVGSGKAVFQALMKKGVIIRDMTAYGLPEWIRVSIGTMEQNRRFLAELKALGVPVVAPTALG